MRRSRRLCSTSIAFLAGMVLDATLSAGPAQQGIDLGDSVRAEILAAEDAVEVIFAAVADARLDVKVKAGKGGDLIPSLSLKDESGAELFLGANLISKGSKAQIKSFPIPSSGTYTLEIGAASGSGDFTARTKGKFPKKLQFAGHFPTSDTLTFDVLAGSLLKGGKVKAVKGTTYEPEILELSDSSGSLRIEGNTARGSSAGFKSALASAGEEVKWVRVSWVLGGTGEGGFNARISAKAPRSKRKFDLAGSGIPGFAIRRQNPQTGLKEYRHLQTGIEFVLLPGGSFQMGSPGTEPNRSLDEGPVHTVTLSPFLIAKYEVTQSGYEAVMGVNPSGFRGDGSRPVESVSWNDLKAANGFLDRTGLSLPTEAQWEYAARGGTLTAFSFGDGCHSRSCDPCARAEGFLWWCGNSGNSHHPVGEKQANPFGLHDMHGNVWEWCEDVYDAAFFSKPAAAGPDPLAVAGSGNRVIRGGSFFQGISDSRSAARIPFDPSSSFPTVGFRPTSPLP